jgi:hypothetical protein
LFNKKNCLTNKKQCCNIFLLKILLFFNGSKKKGVKKLAITNKKLYAILNKRLRDEGYENNTHFARASGIPYSRETTSRAFEPHPTRDISNDTLLIILKYLNFSKKEMVEILKNYTDDKDLWPLITEGSNLTRAEEALVTIVRALRPEHLDMLANQLELLGAAAQKDFSEPLEAIRKFTKKER